jgi:hypothetical protein
MGTISLPQSYRGRESLSFSKNGWLKKIIVSLEFHSGFVFEPTSCNYEIAPGVWE